MKRASVETSAKARVTVVLESPLGPLLAGASDAGLCRLEFTDMQKMERTFTTERAQLGCALVPGEHRWLRKLRTQLQEYFAGKRQEFDIPLDTHGTPFQEKVWAALRRIPYGQTSSYAEIARRIRQPTAQRAVARANALNGVCLLIPCHRVIGKDGGLTGYGGGLWRKRLLLELERTGRWPG